jgi:nuclear GTP-binding protein
MCQQVETVLKGVVRAERLDHPADFVAPILDRVKKEYITKQYGVQDWEAGNHMDFLTQYAQRTGKLVKGGEPDINCVAVQVINDWQRGKIPYFVPPPKSVEGDEGNDEEEDGAEDDDDAMHAEHSDDEGT